jgi:hypothetical protein
LRDPFPIEAVTVCAPGGALGVFYGFYAALIASRANPIKWN